MIREDVRVQARPAGEAGRAAPPIFVDAAGLAVVYPGGVEALRDVSLTIRKGQFVSLVGPSGCGKSTLLKVMAGLVSPSRGRLSIGEAGDRAQSSADRRRARSHSVAFVFQDPTLLSWRTVAGNVRLPLELRGQRSADEDHRIREVLGWVGLTEFAGAFPPQLSGGMRMRASLARALVTRPDLLLLDEPFGALDDITRQRLNEDLVGLWLRDRWTGLFVTHNVTEAVYLGQRVLVMSNRPGRIAAEVPVDLPQPRPGGVRTSPEFNRIVAEVSEQLARVT